MSLKLGEWKININGFQTALALDSVAVNGEVRGTLTGLPIVGLWDETSRTFSFAEQAGNMPNRVSPQFFTGYLFSTPRNLEPGQDVVWTLAGSFQVLDQNNLQINRGNARRNTFGWFAQITEVS